jgi:hypothetical protein
MHRYWAAANYVTVAQIYLRDNPLLREPLRPEQIKPRLLGHWGTSPGLSLIYVHLNRLIRERDADVMYLAGPGHGGPALVGLAYLEGTYSEVYPEVTQEEAGLRLLSQPYHLDATHPTANKGIVIERLSHYFDIPLEQIATLGDQMNDVLMFKRSGLSIAMGNASDEVRRLGAPSRRISRSLA